MKLSIKVAALLFFSLLFAAFPVRVWAQAVSPGNSAPTIPPSAAPSDLLTTAPTVVPTEVPNGVITGKIINKNDSARPVSDLEVMLHVLDQDMNEIGMLHGKSEQDDSFKIVDVPYQVGMGYTAAVVYEGTTYYSQVVPAEAGKTSANLEIQVYESTTDLSKVQVEQMHVLFSFAQDGIEMKELYVLSNKGDRTVKDAVEVPGNNGIKAAVRFTLPVKADFIYFQPQDEGRFLKFPGGFADTTSIVPGQGVSQILVDYLMPYATPNIYQLKTTLAVQSVNFLVPKDSGVTLKGNGLGQAETASSPDGQFYEVYKLENIPAGQALDLSLEGKVNIPKGQAAESANTTNFPIQLPLFIGLGMLGAGLIGGGALWWVLASRNEGRNDEEDNFDGQESRQTIQEEFDSLLTEIALLDQDFEQAILDDETYQNKRALLLSQAKDIQKEMPESSEEANLE